MEFEDENIEEFSAASFLENFDEGEFLSSVGCKIWIEYAEKLVMIVSCGYGLRMRDEVVKVLKWWRNGGEEEDEREKRKKRD